MQQYGIIFIVMQEKSEIFQIFFPSFLTAQNQQKTFTRLQRVRKINTAKVQPEDQTACKIAKNMNPHDL